MILGDPHKFISGFPSLGVALPRGGVQSFVDFLRGGLIPQLDACWGEPFDQTTLAHAAELRNRLLNPVSVPYPIAPPGSFEIQSQPDGVNFNFPIDLVRSGAKRTFVIRGGPAVLVSPGPRYTALPAGQRFVVRGQDFGIAKIWVCKCPSNGGPVLTLKPNETAHVMPDGGAFAVEEWSCTCGKCHCEIKAQAVFLVSARHRCRCIFAHLGL